MDQLSMEVPSEWIFIFLLKWNFLYSEIFLTVFVCQGITLHHTKKMLDHIWVNEGVKFCKIHRHLMMTMLQISRCNPFENIAPDLHPKEETLPEDKLANSNVFCNQMYLEEL